MLYLIAVSALLIWALIVLPGTAHESLSDAERGTKMVYFGCAGTSVGGFFFQAMARYIMIQEPDSESLWKKGLNKLKGWVTRRSTPKS